MVCVQCLWGQVPAAPRGVVRDLPGERPPARAASSAAVPTCTVWAATGALQLSSAAATSTSSVMHHSCGAIAGHGDACTGGVRSRHLKLPNEIHGHEHLVAQAHTAHAPVTRPPTLTALVCGSRRGAPAHSLAWWAGAVDSISTLQRSPTPLYVYGSRHFATSAKCMQKVYGGHCKQPWWTGNCNTVAPQRAPLDRSPVP